VKTTSAPVVSLEAGSYRGVRLGDRPAKLFAEFGRREPITAAEPFTTLANPEGSYAAPVVTDPARKGPFSYYRYEHVAAMFNEGELRLLLIDDPSAATAEGIRMGGPLDRVKSVYKNATCGLAQENTEYEPYPACYLPLSPDRHVWFGGDPISSIEIAAMRIGDLPAG
jgi:hypothetical protein